MRMPSWRMHRSTTASTTISYTANYDDYVIQADEQFDKKMFRDFEMTIEKHRDKKNKVVKKEYMFNPDNLDL